MSCSLIPSFACSFFCSRLFVSLLLSFFFFNDTATTEIYTLSLHDALPISTRAAPSPGPTSSSACSCSTGWSRRSEEHTSELQSLRHLVCRLLLEKKKKKKKSNKTRQKYQRKDIQVLQILSRLVGRGCGPMR